MAFSIASAISGGIGLAGIIAGVKNAKASNDTARFIAVMTMLGLVVPKLLDIYDKHQQRKLGSTK